MIEKRMNSSRGKSFQELSAELLSRYFGVSFLEEIPILIGNPAKNHRFDLVSEDKRYIGECKNYSYTIVGNIPSAKIATLNEAVLYLSLLTFPAERFLVMPKSTHEKKAESLTAYYFRTYQHVLNGVFIVELDGQTGEITELGRRPN